MRVEEVSEETEADIHEPPKIPTRAVDIKQKIYYYKKNVGFWVQVPTTTNSYHLHITRTYDVQPYRVYAVCTCGRTAFWFGGSVQTRFSTAHGARRA